MSDDFRTRIAGVLGGHIEDQLTNYDAGRNECGCGQQGNATYRDHVADAVIRELNLSIAVYYKTSQGREVCVEGYWTEEEATDGTA